MTMEAERATKGRRKSSDVGMKVPRRQSVIEIGDDDVPYLIGEGV